MDQLTAFERSLLVQFESLEAACEASLKSSGDTANALLEFSEYIGKRVRSIEARQEALSTHLQGLSTVLSERTQQTQALVDAVNRLLDEQTY